MRMPLSIRSSLVLSCLLLAATSLPLQVSAQTVQTADYIYIGIEAEDHVNKHERWVTTTPSTPTEENDPDGNHSDQAGGSTYLELLPDVRVTHDDTFGPPLAYWGRGGQGPDADYLVDFPEPGRYYVHVRAYSTGTEDNGMHVGLNGNWPASGERMQFCTAHHRAWWWSSAQRDSGGNGSCGTEKTIWLDVPSAGVHTVSISAREDGFEIDKLALMKDLSGNTRVCEPTTLSGVNCRNGSIESADGFVDLRVILSAEIPGADPEVEPPNPVEVVQGENISLTAKIENLDAFDTANEIVLTLSPVPGDWNMIAMDDRCVVAGDEFECSLNSLHPTAPNEFAPFVFTMQARLDGDIRIDASLLSADVDESPANDVAATIVRVLPGTAPVDQDTDISLSMGTDKGQYETGETVALTIEINNQGNFAADNVQFNLSLPAGVSLSTQSVPADCNGTEPVECNFARIEAEENESFTLELTADDDGLHTISANIGALNDINSTNNLDSDSFVVTEPVVETTTAGEADSAGSADGAQTAGNTDGAATAGDTDGSTSGETTEGQTAGSTTDAGTTAGDSGTQGTTDSGTTSGSDTTAGAADTGVTSAGETTSQTAGDSGATPTEDTKSAALVHWVLFVLLMVFLTRLYGRHQRQRVTIDK